MSIRFGGWLRLEPTEEGAVAGGEDDGRLQPIAALTVKATFPTTAHRSVA